MPSYVCHAIVRKFLACVLFLVAPLVAQGHFDVTIGNGPGTRSIKVDPSSITGGSVRITTDNGDDITLTAESGTVTIELPVGKKIKFQSSNGKWWEITNNGSSLAGARGVGASASGPDSPDLEALFENEGWQ
jgi:hypothetical protein